MPPEYAVEIPVSEPVLTLRKRFILCEFLLYTTCDAVCVYGAAVDKPFISLAVI
jgi:hypothetical protein